MPPGKNAPNYFAVAKLTDIKPDYPIRVRVGRHDVALIKIDGEIFAIDNICTHSYVSLADGFVNGDIIECPLHGACFNIRTGKVVSPPATVDLKTYAVRIEGDDVLVGWAT